jgi:8-amino-7-oxononanoate synthase
MFEEDIKRLTEKGLFRKIHDRGILSHDTKLAAGARIVIDSIEFINFASNDYLGLSASPALADAARKALDTFAFGAGASRLLSGGTEFHALLEKAVAHFKGAEASLVFNSGYQANTCVIPAIAGQGDVIFSDELNHASIVDGCRLSRAKKVIYNHRDMDHLSLLIDEEGWEKKKIIVSDTVFSMDGDIAPVGKLYEICCGMPGTMLYLDDAHGTGVLGGGRGALAHFDLKPEPWIVQMGTFSKALGSFGAFVAGNRKLIDWLINTSRGFIYSTALPSCVVAASAAAIKIVEGDKSLNDKLWKNQRRAVEGIRNAGFDVVSGETPIIAVVVGDVSKTLAFSGGMKQKKVFAPAIRPPTVKTPRIRITVSAAHSDEDIETLISAFSEIR